VSRIPEHYTIGWTTAQQSNLRKDKKRQRKRESREQKAATLKEKLLAYATNLVRMISDENLEASMTSMDEALLCIGDEADIAGVVFTRVGSVVEKWITMLLARQALLEHNRRNEWTNDPVGACYIGNVQAATRKVLGHLHSMGIVKNEQGWFGDTMTQSNLWHLAVTAVSSGCDLIGIILV